MLIAPNMLFYMCWFEHHYHPPSHTSNHITFTIGKSQTSFTYPPNEMEHPTTCNNTVAGSSIASILDTATTRWLTVEEIVTLLPSTQNIEIKCGPSLPSQIAPPSKPPKSGTVLLYNRFAVRNYKKDGHDWIRKRSNPAKIREDHVKLRYNGAYRVDGNYVHSEEIETLHRRVYRLIKTPEEKAASDTKVDFVLVHYLDTEEAAKMSMKEAIAPQPSSSGTTGTKRMWSSDDTTSPYMYSSYEQHQPAPSSKRLRTDIGSYKYGSNTVDRGSTTCAHTQQQDPRHHMCCAPDTNQYSISAPSYLPTMMQTSFPSVIVTPPIPTKEVTTLDSVSFDVLCKAIDDNNSGLLDALNFYYQI